MNKSDECWFNHERLEVYCEAIAFIGWLSQLLDGMPRVADVKDQLDRASASVAFNIAERNGKYALKTAADFSTSRTAQRLSVPRG